MKRGGELKRGAPLKPGTKGLSRSPMPRSTVTLGRTHMARRTGGFKDKVPLPRASVMSQEQDEKPKKRSRGLKGRAPTTAERAFMDRAGQIPCLACTKDGRHNPHVLLHHTDGRTKPGAHFKVLPICPPHHVPDDTDPLGRVSVHGAKKVFAEKYGSEAQLLAELYALLNFSVPI